MYKYGYTIIGIGQQAKSSYKFLSVFQINVARLGGVEVAGWTAWSEDPGLIPGIPSPPMGPLMAMR